MAILPNPVPTPLRGPRRRATVRALAAATAGVLFAGTLVASPASAQPPTDLTQAGSPAASAVAAPLPVGSNQDEAAAEQAEKVFERYVFASFHGGDDGGRNGEQIWLSASKGNDPFNWYELNYDQGTSVSQPILQTVNPPLGQAGLRDPSLIRSADGESFFLLATDLKTYQDGQSWNFRQSRGSRNLVVYESDDLVNWSAPRFVKVEDDHAGNVWAPEAFYDAKNEQYIVFWASNLYPDTNISTRSTSQISYNRIRISTTKDFVTFTTPTTWVNLDRSTGQQGWGMIDSTMIAADNKIYRLTKDENGFRVLLQYIDSLDDLYDTWGVEETTPFVTNRNPITPLTQSANAWTMVGNANGSSKWQIPGLNGGNLEGPIIFKDNTDDMWYAFIDYASGGGYVAWRSDSMNRPPNEWEYLGQSWCNSTGLSSNCTAQSATSPYWSLPVSPRHGSVIPVTLDEWKAVMAGSNSPVHVEASLVTAGGAAVAEGAWVNAAPRLKVNWTDFNNTGLAPAWLRLVEGHNGGPRTVAPQQITSGIAQDMTIPLNAVEGTNWAQVEYRDASLGGDAVMLWTTDVPYNLDMTVPTTSASFDPETREITITSADEANGSQLASTEYRIGAGEWMPYTAPFAAGSAAATVQYRATDVAGNVSVVKSINVPATAPEFIDVSPTNPFLADITWMAENGISTGTVTDNGVAFQPGLAATRQAVAAFLYRMENDGATAPACTTAPYSDVPVSATFCGEISWLKSQNITGGYANNTFRPGATIDRQAMAAFLYRFANDGATAPACTTAPFTDVAVSANFCGEISWLEAEGITEGFPDGTFQPTGIVQRQALAAFLHRLSMN